VRREPITAAERQLIDHLKTFRQFKEQQDLTPEGFVYSCREAFLMQHGEFFEPRALPSEIERGEQKACFRNAVMHASLTRDAYVEGVGVAKISETLWLPTEHAWNVTPDGLLIDSTWEHGIAYFGVRFDVGVAFRAISKGCTVLDNYHDRYKLYRKAFTPAKEMVTQ
jgi:hypothetical protein